MAQLINKSTILSLLPGIDVVAAMEEGFKIYSNGGTVVPPVGELIFDKPSGETHIKYGYIKDEDFYVIKIASGFYDNPGLGLPSSQGMMLVLSQKTGGPVAILLDEGYLTDIRTAAAGAVAAKYLAPKLIEGIGIIGTGIQARMQLDHLRQITNCKNVWVWGRSEEKATQFKVDMGGDFNIEIAATTEQLAQNCNLIVSTTPAKSPLLFADAIRPGTHITAMGSDTSEKQELAVEVLAKADRIVVDSLPQSKSRGEVYQAVKAGSIKEEDVIELGQVIQNTAWQREHAAQITVADLTGVAVQDIMIATSVYQAFQKQQ